MRGFIDVHNITQQ